MGMVWASVADFFPGKAWGGYNAASRKAVAEGGKERERRVPADGSPDLIASSEIRPGHGIPSLTMVAVEKVGEEIS